jgi:hypothetical protein
MRLWSRKNKEVGLVWAFEVVVVEEPADIALADTVVVVTVAVVVETWKRGDRDKLVGNSTAVVIVVVVEVVVVEVVVVVVVDSRKKM